MNNINRVTQVISDSDYTWIKQSRQVEVEHHCSFLAGGLTDGLFAFAGSGHRNQGRFRSLGAGLPKCSGNELALEAFRHCHNKLKVLTNG